MPYKIIAYIPAESDEEIIFETKKEAEKEKEQMEFLQPENIYKIVKIDKDEIHSETNE